MKPLVVDTSIFVDHLRGYPPASHALTKAFTSQRRVAAGILSLLELRIGSRQHQHQALQRLASIIEWVSVDRKVAENAGDLAARYGPNHNGIDPVDYTIAATAITLNAELWTRNTRHFPMFPNLKPPYSAPPKIS